jgi:hypothetical protein
VHVKDTNSNLWYRITFVYGEQRAEHHYLMWETLRRSHAASDLSWMVVGGGGVNETLWGF